MAADYILRSYGDVAAKEDVVLNAIELLTATEDTIQSKLGRSKAINTVHAYLTDTLPTYGSGAVEEASDYSYSALSTPTRLTNVVQLTVANGRVSDIQRSIEHYHGQDELQRQINKALKDFANKVEYDLVRSTLVSGVSGTTSKVSGILEAISKSTNVTAHNSGTEWSATILDALLANNWENSNGDVATDLFMGASMARQTDSFTQKTNSVMNNVPVTTIVKTVSTYTNSFGSVQIHKHRMVQISTDATARVLGINRDKLKIAWLMMPRINRDLAKTGPFTPFAVEGAWTLEVRNQDSNFYSTGFKK